MTVAWEENAPNSFVAQIGIYEAAVSDSDSGECWSWHLDHVGARDPKVEFASGFFVGDAAGARLRAEEMAAVFSQHLESP